MGWDIRAWVEVHMPWMEVTTNLGYDTWHPVVDASILIDRDYDAFGCLFGVKNHAHFAPIAGGRGLPNDVSSRVREDATAYVKVDPETGFVSPSWITWAELERVDWDELALHPDQRLHQFVRDEHGSWVYETKAGWDRDFAQIVGHDLFAAVRGECPPWPDGAEWLVGDKLYRAVRLRRRDALGEDWQTLFAIMRELAKRFTPDGVRLVVWFYF